jgi:hypothetical protein
MKSIKVTPENWISIFTKIQNTHPRSVWLLRDNMKKVLGFTPRSHSSWDRERFRYADTLYLDFFDEKKQIMFMIKYSEYL